ncbi:MAG: alpha/beta hydrolase [Actinomycetota bacterium]|nr:alpha/beta hydrolase [Actinomycetota bacterium]
MVAFRVGALVLAWVLATILVLCTVLMFVPGPTGELWLLGTVAAEQALVITVVAVVLAVLLRRRVMFVVIGAVVAAVSLIPTVASASAAPGVDWREYLAGTSLTAPKGPDATEAFATVEGAELRADLWFPLGDGRDRPAVVWVHGGGLEDAGRRGETPEWNLLLARTGAVVVDIDYRLTPAGRWRDQAADVGCAVGWVGANAARLGVNPNRIALVGASAGGHLALLSAYAPDDLPPSCNVAPVRPSAVVAFEAATDMAPLHGLDSWRYPDLGGLTEDLERLVGGTPATNPDAYAKASPRTHVRPDVPPTLIIHGANDQIVPVAQARTLVAMLRDTGARHRYVELPYANHWFDLMWGSPNTQHARAALVDFLDL